MDSVETTFIQENLSGYNLPPDTLVEIHTILMRRFTVKFSEGLSPEGRKAMELAATKDSMSEAYSGNDMEDIDGGETCNYTSRNLQKRRSKTISFISSFEEALDEKCDKNAANANGLKVRRSSSARFSKDLLTKNYGDASTTVNTMQVVEDDKRHSVEKCLVWMETQNRDPTKIPEYQII